MKRGIIFILLGAFLWGTISFFVKNLYSFGFTPMEVVTLRVGFATIILMVYMILSTKHQMKLQHLSDLKYFIGTGICSITFFNYCMFKTMQLSTVQISVALLYTGPAFVIIISYFLFKEAFTWDKCISLLCTFIGIIFVVELIPFDAGSFPFMTIIIGLGSGLGYALYSIFSKYALTKYNSLTITFYTFLMSMLVLIPFFPFKQKGLLLIEYDVLFYALGLGLFPTAIAYIVYTYGLNETEASTAAILSTVEPVVATLIGISIFLEPFSFLQIIGMFFIIGAILMIQLRTN